MAKPSVMRRAPNVPVPAGPELVPQDLAFFRPPKGMDVITPLTELPREFSPLIRNLVLDRGVLRSKDGVEKYHDADVGQKLQLTTDLGGSASVTSDVTNKTTANQGTAAGWTDPDGTSDGQNLLTVDAATPFPIAAVGNRLFNTVGDPTAGTAVDAWDDKYDLKFSITANRGTFQVGGVNEEITAIVDIEYSTDGGASWTTLAPDYRVISGPTSTTITFEPTVTIPGSPSQLRFRLKLRAEHSSGAPSGSGTISVKVFATVWLTDTFPVTWAVLSATSIAERIPMRWTGARIQVYDDPTEVAGPWTTAYTFPNTQINSDSLLPTFVPFGSVIVSSDVGDTVLAGNGNPIGSRGLVETKLSSPYTTTVLANSPRAAHLAVFGGRIVASRVNEQNSQSAPQVEAGARLNRIRWSVKNNHTDWIGIGSGFEDFSTPSGQTDEVMGVFPVNDETAIVVNERTIRRMDVTGFVDAPFRFGMLAAFGTRSRYTIRQIPGGVIFLGYDDVVVFTFEGIRRIGTRALRESLKLITNPRLAVGYYDQYNSRYLLSYKEGATTVAWSYSFLDDGWTKIALPFDVVNIDRAFHTVSGVLFFGVYFTQAQVGGFSCRENPTRTQDVDTGGLSVDSPIEIRTGLVLHDSPLHEVQLVETHLVYESAGAHVLTFEHSTDGGSTWTQYATRTIGATTRPTTLRITKSFAAQVLQLRVASTTLGDLKLISLHAFATKGPRINP